MYDYPETVEEVFELMDELIGDLLAGWVVEEDDPVALLLQLQLEKATALYFQG